MDDLTKRLSSRLARLMQTGRSDTGLRTRLEDEALPLIHALGSECLRMAALEMATIAGSHRVVSAIPRLNGETAQLNEGDWREVISNGSPELLLSAAARGLSLKGAHHVLLERAPRDPRWTELLLGPVSAAAFVLDQGFRFDDLPLAGRSTPALSAAFAEAQVRHHPAETERHLFAACNWRREKLVIFLLLAGATGANLPALLPRSMCSLIEDHQSAHGRMKLAATYGTLAQVYARGRVTP